MNKNEKAVTGERNPARTHSDKLAEALRWLSGALPENSRGRIHSEKILAEYEEAKKFSRKYSPQQIAAVTRAANARRRTANEAFRNKNQEVA